MEEIHDNVTALSDEIRGNVTALSEAVKSLDEKVSRAHGHVTKTALPSLSSRLDILEKRATRVPLNVAGESPPSLPSEPNSVAGEPPPSLPPEPNAAPPPAALPMVLPSDPPDETIPMPPRVPARSPAMVVAECAHTLAPPHFLPRLNMASPGPTTGTSGNTAPMAEPPDPLANSRIAFAALRVRMSQEATDETSGTPTVHGCPTRRPTKREISAPLLRQHTPRPDGMLHRTHIPPPNPPLDTNNPPFANHSYVVVSLSTVVVMMILVATVTTEMMILVVTGMSPLALVSMATTPMATTPTPLGMFRLGGRQLCPLDTATGPCMPARWVLVVSML
jgi:hypothetical protein